MSNVSDFILTAPIDEPGIIALNKRLMSDENYCACFNQVDRYAGGNKAFQADVWMAAFRNVDMRDFKAHVFSVSWSEPERIRFFVQHEHEYSFQQVDML